MNILLKIIAWAVLGVAIMLVLGILSLSINDLKNETNAMYAKPAETVKERKITPWTFVVDAFHGVLSLILLPFALLFNFATSLFKGKEKA